MSELNIDPACSITQITIFLKLNYLKVIFTKYFRHLDYAILCYKLPSLYYIESNFKHDKHNQ